MNPPTDQRAPHYVTCPCNHCNGKIEFDADGLAEENSIIPCPHCGLETRLLIPETTIPAELAAHRAKCKLSEEEQARLVDYLAGTVAHRAKCKLSEEEQERYRRKLHAGAGGLGPDVISAQGHLKIACPSCGKRIEFPRERLGQVINCPGCGLSVALNIAGVSPAATPPGSSTGASGRFGLLGSPYRNLSRSKGSSTGASGGFGLLLFIIGLIGVIYFLVFFDTSVDVPRITVSGQTIGGGRVHNIGLMQERQNGLIISGISAALGVVCILFGQYGGKKG